MVGGKGSRKRLQRRWCKLNLHGWMMLAWPKKGAGKGERMFHTQKASRNSMVWVGNYKQLDMAGNQVQNKEWQQESGDSSLWRAWWATPRSLEVIATQGNDWSLGQPGSRCIKLLFTASQWRVNVNVAREQTRGCNIITATIQLPLSKHYVPGTVLHTLFI